MFYRNHGCNGFVQMEHHFVPIHHLPFNLALQYPIFLGMLDLSQGCDHVAKALGLNHKACHYCFHEGASLLALLLFALLFIFSRCKKFFFHWSLCPQVANVLFFTMALCFHPITIFFFAFGIFVLKLLPSSSSHWSSCSQATTILLFTMVFMY